MLTRILEFLAGSLIFFMLISCHYSGKTVIIESGNSIDTVSGDNTTLSDYPGKTITVCTFNIQFLGSFKKRDNAALAEMLRKYGIVVIQELTSPPIDGLYPDRSHFSADPEASAFLSAMTANGFHYLLSVEDTGTGDKIHSGGTGTEWFISFYDSSQVTYAPDLPHGFLAEDRSNNPDYERVPYAFPFRTVSGKNDFVLISVHLNPGGGEENRQRRVHELNSIYNWISRHNNPEKDFIVLGDMNIEDSTELSEDIPAEMISLNNECRVTNTLVNQHAPDFGGRPYDQILYFPEFTTEDIDTTFDCEVIDLKKAMKTYWKGPGPYPGDPYVHNIFRQYYSDHDPLTFRIRVLEKDND